MKESKAGKKHVDHELVEQEFTSVFEKHFKVNIDLAVIGLRNLVRAAVDPVVRVRLTHGIEESA